MTSQSSKAAEKPQMDQLFLARNVQITNPVTVVKRLDLSLATQMIVVMVSWDTLIILIIGQNVLFECLSNIMFQGIGINAWVIILKCFQKNRDMYELWYGHTEKRFIHFLLI